MLNVLSVDLQIRMISNVSSSGTASSNVQPSKLCSRLSGTAANAVDLPRYVPNAERQRPPGLVRRHRRGRVGARGWLQYYGTFYRSTLFPLLRRINAYLMRWIRKEFKRLRKFKKAHECWQRVTRQHPRFFAHWAWTPTFW